MESKRTSCHGSWQWMLFDKLKRKKLEITLVNLAKRERQEWVAFHYKSAKDEKDITAQERRAIAEWQGTVAIQFFWEIETRFDAVSLFDDVMRKVRVANRLQVAVAAATLCVAAKLNEEEENLNSSSLIIDTLKVSLSPRDLSRMEIVLLKKLNWKPRPCLVLLMLQTLMGLLVVFATSRVDGQEADDLGHELLHFHLESMMRLLFTLIVQPESAEIRPSILSLTLVYFHLDWNQKIPYKKQLMTWFQRLLSVNDEELERGRIFAYPLVGVHFYPEYFKGHYFKEFPERVNSYPKKITSYNALQRPTILSPEIYSHLKPAIESSLNSNTESSEMDSASPSITPSEEINGTKCKGRKANDSSNFCSKGSQPRFLVNKARARKKKKNTSKLTKQTSHQTPLKKQKGDWANKENATEAKGVITKEIELLFEKL